MPQQPDPKKTDSLGRNRLPSERYSQHGGSVRPKHIVWTCKVCSRAWNVTSKSYRYDSKCRQCGTRNTILLTLPKSYIKSRKRITKFSFYPTAEMAQFIAQKRNQNWMRRKTKSGFGTSTFVKGSELNIHQDERTL